MAKRLYKSRNRNPRRSSERVHILERSNLTVALICLGAATYLVTMVVWMQQVSG